MKTDEFLSAGKEAAELVMPLFKKSFGRALDVRDKNDEKGNIVSEVDLAIEKRLVAFLSKKFPDHQFIGEEFSPDDVSKKDLIWYIDPVDGTTNYVMGLPECAISLALWHKGKPCVAIVADPLRGNIFSAAKGQGASINGRKLCVSKAAELNDAIGAIGWRNKDQGLRLIAQIMPRSKKIRVLGSIALQLCYVAGGSLDYLAATSAKIWDVAAGVLIVEEAGGRLSDWQNKPIDIHSATLLADNGYIHDELVSVLSAK